MVVLVDGTAAFGYSAPARVAGIGKALAGGGLVITLVAGRRWAFWRIVAPQVAGASLGCVDWTSRSAVLENFRWEQGHADVWRIFADATALCTVVEGLVAPWQGEGVTHVLGIESRGFLLGGAAAVALRAGFVAVRKSGTGLLPGPKVRTTAGRDYRGLSHDLRMQQVVRQGDRVLMVDDWAERGSQAAAAKTLVEQCEGHWLGLAVIVDQLSEDRRGRLGRVTRLLDADELGPADHGSVPQSARGTRQG